MKQATPATAPNWIGLLSLPSASNKTRASTEAGGKKGPSFRRLPVQFRFGSFQYKEIAREQSAAIYAQMRDCKVIAYEVIRVRRRAAFVIGGRTVLAAEIYPPSEKWGTDGWTVSSPETAFAKLKQITR
jgi:hypothetical protein